MRGIEVWASLPGGTDSLGLYTATGAVTPGAIPGTNQSIRWAADMTTQIVNGVRGAGRHDRRLARGAGC